MQIDRLFEIVHILLNQKITTTRELAERFEVTKRTILRDINTLSLAGIPITTSAGKGGGISIHDTYKLDKTYLSDGEREQILLGLQTLLPTRQINSEDIINKLSSFFDVDKNSWIEVEYSSWSHPTVDKDKFEKLKNATIYSHSIRFIYSNGNGLTSERTVNPLKLVFKNNSWYLSAYCLSKNDYRFFKLSRISNLSVLKDSFDKSKYHISTSEKKMQYTEFFNLKAIFSSEVAYRVYDEFNNQDIVKNNNGTLTVTTKFLNTHWTTSYFLSFGANVKIISPVVLQKEIKDIFNNIQNIYSNSDI